MLKPVILFRADEDTRDEFEICKDVFGSDRVFRYRSNVPSNSLVICRYSCLPFYQELELELKQRGSEMLNSYTGHLFISKMGYMASLQRDKVPTPETWFVGPSLIPETEHGYVVKGLTNSRKFRWNTHMFAPDKDALLDVVRRLHEDMMLSEQGLVIREYVPLETFETGINDLPITNEWRFFFIDNKMLASGYYWSIAECAEEMGEPPVEAVSLATVASCSITSTLNSKCRGLVIDVARTKDGDWIVIEVNDLQMSGLSMTDPVKLYTSIRNLFPPQDA